MRTEPILVTQATSELKVRFRACNIGLSPALTPVVFPLTVPSRFPCYISSFFVRPWFHMWRLLGFYLLLISPSFGGSEGLYLHISSLIILTVTVSRKCHLHRKSLPMAPKSKSKYTTTDITHIINQCKSKPLFCLHPSPPPHRPPPLPLPPPPAASSHNAAQRTSNTRTTAL